MNDLDEIRTTCPKCGEIYPIERYCLDGEGLIHLGGRYVDGVFRVCYRRAYREPAWLRIMRWLVGETSKDRARRWLGLVPLALVMAGCAVSPVPASDPNCPDYSVDPTPYVCQLSEGRSEQCPAGYGYGYSCPIAWCGKSYELLAHPAAECVTVDVGTGDATLCCPTPNG